VVCFEEVKVMGEEGEGEKEGDWGSEGGKDRKR
jgi:hypothetical protein